LPIQDQKLLRDAFSAFPTGVTVVTCMDSDGDPLGFTANSFASVSLEPPLLLVCLSKHSFNYASFIAARGFAVNILSECQKGISNTFAKPVADRFASVEWQIGPHGAPILADVAAWFDCSMHQIVDSGDHVIMIGEVQAFDNKLVNTLGFSRGSYFSAAIADQAVAAAASDAEVRIEALVEREGEVLLFQDERNGFVLPGYRLSRTHSPTRMESLLARDTNLSISIGPVYSVYQDRQRQTRHIVYRGRAGEGESSHGSFHPINSLNALTFTDSAVEDTLKRFVREAGIGNFNVYFGTDLSGTVHHLSNED